MNLTKEQLDAYIDRFGDEEYELDDNERQMLSGFIEFVHKCENYDGPEDDPNPGEPPISNEERLRSGMIKPR